MINSAFSTGVRGVEYGLQRLDKAANDIAQQAVSQDGLSQQSQESDPSVNPLAGRDATLAESMVDLKRSEHQVAASAAVIKAADETLGTLIDTFT